MFVTHLKAKSDCRAVADAQVTSSKKLVFLMGMHFIITLKRSGQASLSATASSVLADAYVKVPESGASAGVYMAPFTEPDLVFTGNDRTFYSDRSDIIEGCDFISLPSSYYDWTVTDAVQEFDETMDVWMTMYKVEGRWSHIRGLFHSLDK